MENLYIELIQWRSVERVISILIGGLSIAAGWHLFLRGIVQEQSAGISTQTIKVSMQKVGPGVFFALFGAWVVINISTTQASLEGINTSFKSNDTATKSCTSSVKLAFLSSAQEPWQLKFVSATKQLELQHVLLNEALSKLENPNIEEIRKLKSAISELAMSRKIFLMEAFPPLLREACKNGVEVPEGYTQDNCELFKEYQGAVSK
ncbi:hypothetical protein [Rheinheimera faecalis]|uniref:hypothetical protein n=1 Tax=Rheinheimera faecalis TaxID=2901141 RepID=UPI001E2AAD41|nr:hypothetical protein [Rheinheimera faecalis]